MKPPKIGDQIVHHRAHLEPPEQTLTGTVTDIYASQFAYETEEGRRELCLFSENWKPFKEAS